jgi:hypothetical protein
MFILVNYFYRIYCKIYEYDVLFIYRLMLFWLLSHE